MKKQIFYVLSILSVIFQTSLSFAGKDSILIFDQEQEDEYRAYIHQSVKNQLEQLALDPEGNNALFIGRTEEQGADSNNTGSIGPKNLVNEQTHWVFLDCAQRESKSSNDIILTIEDLIDFIDNTAANQLTEKFKLVVIDSGVSCYIINMNVLNKLIDWVAPGEDTALLFEHIPCNVYSTCSGSFSAGSTLSALQAPWKKQEKWEQGEEVFFVEIGQNSLPLRAFPNVRDPFCKIYFNTKLEDKVWDNQDFYENSAKYIELVGLQNQMMDMPMVNTFNALRPELGAYFDGLRVQKIQSALTKVFNVVEFKANDNEHYDAPFVKSMTYAPSQCSFWWVASAKK
ncbi:MAG: hypothetical protein Q8L85_06170 [Alphaproteobacteria bacterium]|nr:hypothetical protein [Alphaproteobacteria bacterium]